MSGRGVAASRPKGPASRNDEKSILSGRSGRRSKREVVVKEPFVIIIPVLPDGRLLLKDGSISAAGADVSGRAHTLHKVKEKGENEV